MRFTRITLLIALPFVAALTIFYCARASKPVERPEEIRSKRLVTYDQPTYAKLEALWKTYYKEFPSEFAYANWMYAARYAGDPEYTKLLAKGLKKWPSNPVLLYLTDLASYGGLYDPRGRALLQKAIAIDPNFVDPWFSLAVDYMAEGDDDSTDAALKRILQSGYVTEETMDYNYNVLIGLDSNVILLTNGDNDTYPAWILTRVLKIRPDVTIVNRSLLNAEWYPLNLIKHGLPSFITADELKNLRKDLDAKRAASGNHPTQAGPYSDSLITRLVDAADKANRPFYLGLTLPRENRIADYWNSGRLLGLALRVHPSEKPAYTEQLEAIYAIWLKQYRTGGLDSWRLHNCKPMDAGRYLAGNYASVILQTADPQLGLSKETRLSLFHWYAAHVDGLLPSEFRSKAVQAWSEDSMDIEEIRNWCATQSNSK